MPAVDLDDATAEARRDPACLGDGVADHDRTRADGFQNLVLTRRRDRDRPQETAYAPTADLPPFTHDGGCSIR